VDGAASFGSAMAHHPGDVAVLMAGIALMGVGAGGEVLGGALDATGIGALGGVPLNVASAGVIDAGAGVAAVAVGDLGRHAATDDRVSPMEGRADGGSGGGGSGGTKTDRLKEHLTDRDLDAARRELDGEVVATKSGGTPWNHVQEVKEAQNGLLNRISQLKRQLGDTRTLAADRPVLESELAEASRLLDYSEQFVPRPG